MADVGARAAVQSAPGCGTSVVLTWRAPSIPGGGAGGAGSAGGRPRGSASAVELRRAYAVGMRRTAGIVAVAWQAITLVPLIVSLPRTHSPALALLAWLAASVGVALAVGVIRHRPLSRAECLALIALGSAAAAVGAVNTMSTGTAPRYLDWTALELPLLVMLVAVSLPLAEWLLALAATVAVLAAVVLARTGVEPLAVSQLAGVVYGQCALLTFTTMIGPVMRRTAERTAQALEAEAELAAMHDTEILVRRDRARGLGAVERDVLPLLTAVRRGLLDPRDPAVRDRCARHAVAVRRTLAAGQSAALCELAPALVDAEQRGVNLDVQVSGDLRHAPAEIRAELATHVAGALAGVPNEGTTVTLVCDDAGGSLCLTYPGDYPGDPTYPGDVYPGDTAAVAEAGRSVRLPAARPPSHADHPPRPLVAVSTDHDDGRVCLELRWDDVPHPARP
jgi:hypothetical protein